MRIFGRTLQLQLWPTLIAIPLFITAIALGVWQLQRLEWKESLIATLEARQAAEPLTSLPNAGDPGEFDLRRVVLEGRFLPQEFFLMGRSHKGATGLHLLTAFELQDGAVILVDRGWLPERLKDPASRPETLLEVSIELKGTLRLAGWRGSDWAEPENAGANNSWLFVDPPAMAAAASLMGVVSDFFVIAEGDGDETRLPIADKVAIAIPNDHLQYAITWFSLAGVLLVIFVLYHLKKSAKGRDAKL